MAGKYDEIDRMLAAALRDDPGVRAPFAADVDRQAVVDRIAYHGVAGLLHARAPKLVDWPREILGELRIVATAETLWELRHQQLIARLTSALAAAGVTALLLKGTALAYDLYPVPATRSRGDSDLLVDPANLSATRRILAAHGFARQSDLATQDDPFCLQEVWATAAEGGMEHHVDLHWQILNAPALADVLSLADARSAPVTLPRLGPDALAMDHVAMLLHACIHRSVSLTSPYFVADRTYYGGDRLIWLVDIDLLATSFDAPQWGRFAAMASARGVTAACLAGLESAQSFLGTRVPTAVTAQLQTAARTTPRASRYLAARQFGRAWQDLRAIAGVGRKLDYVRARTLPSRAFMRDKYPRLARLPLPLLYARRLVELVRARPQR